MIASCGFEVKFHEWDTCTFLGCYAPPTDSISTTFSDISWSNEGTSLVAVPIAGRSVLIHPRFSSMYRYDQGPITKETIEISSVKSARFPRTDYQNVALGTATGHVLKYSIKSKNANILVDDLPAAVNFLDYGARDEYLVAGCSNGQIFLLQAGIGITASYFVPHSDSLTCLAAHPTISQYLAGGSNKGIVAIWDVNTSCCIMKASQHNGVVIDCAFSGVDEIFATIGDDQIIHIYDLRTATCVHEKQFEVRLTTMAYCPNATDMAVATDRGYVLCMDKRYLKTTRTGVKAHDTPIRKIRFQKEESQPHRQDKCAKTYHQQEKPCDDEPCQYHQRLRTKMASSSASGDYAEGVPGSNLANRLLSAISQSQPVEIPPIPQIQACPNLSEEPTPKVSNSYMPLQASTSNNNLNLNRESQDRFHIIDEASLQRVREEVMNTTNEILTRVMETMNAEFLKMRMTVSRQFCTVELRNKARWQEFNDTLMKLACLDDADENEVHTPRHDNDSNDVAVRDPRNRQSRRPLVINGISDETFVDLDVDGISEVTLERCEPDTDLEMDEIEYNDMSPPAAQMHLSPNAGTTSIPLQRAEGSSSPKHRLRFQSRLPSRQRSSLKTTALGSEVKGP